MVNFLKNMAILGLLLMTLAIPRPWLMSLGTRLLKHRHCAH
jgi:hypothetical protein